MPGEEGAYVRRVAAIVVVTIAVPGEETASAVVTRAREVVCDLMREARGDAEPIAPDGVVAGFLEVEVAVRAALRVRARLAEEEWAAPAAVVRIGVHAADVLLTAEATAFAEAVELARALAEMARPGTVCISDAVRRVLGPRLEQAVEDLGLLPIGPGGSDVHVYLLVPSAAPDLGPRVPRRAIIAGVASAAALGVAAALVLRSMRRRAVGPVTVTLGVMQFKCAGADPAQAWICDAVRDGLNTQLSGLQYLKVYSREFLDFLVTRQGLTEIEVANKLGLEKLLTGRIVMFEGTVRVETQVVDVPTGVIERAYTTTGRQADVLGLQDEVVRGAIERLDLPLTPDDVKRLAQRRTTDPEALRRLLEAEGAAPSPPPGNEPPRPPEPESWLGPASAFADDADAARAAILDFLDRYRRATEARDVDALAALYAAFPREQRVALARYFENVRDLRITIDNVDVAVVGDEAVVSFSRTDDFVDVPTGRTLHVSTRLTKTLRRVGGMWKLGAGR